MKVVYITSHGGTHPIHKAYADAVHADYQYVDFRLRWHDVPTPSWKRYLSWVVCAWTFPNRKKYNIFITGGQQFPAVLMKKLGRVSEKQKIVCLHANETLYFLYAGRYSKMSSIALRWLLKQYDFHICTSQMQTQLLEKLTEGKAKHVFTTYNGVHDERMERYTRIQPDLESQQILLISNLYAGWRLWYKGIDLMIEAIAIVRRVIPVKFIIVGEVQEAALAQLRKQFSEEVFEYITFAGKTPHLEQYFSESALYLHCARGEAFGISVLEAMAAGLPTIVSEWTGAKQVVEKVSPELLVPLDAQEIANKIISYFNLSSTEKQDLSTRCRQVVIPYTQSNAVKSFQEIIHNIANL